ADLLALVGQRPQHRRRLLQPGLPLLRRLGRLGGSPQRIQLPPHALLGRPLQLVAPLPGGPLGAPLLLRPTRDPPGPRPVPAPPRLRSSGLLPGGPSRPPGPAASCAGGRPPASRRPARGSMPDIPRRPAGSASRPPRTACRPRPGSS